MKGIQSFSISCINHYQYNQIFFFLDAHMYKLTHRSTPDSIEDLKTEKRRLEKSGGNIKSKESAQTYHTDTSVPYNFSPLIT